MKEAFKKIGKHITPVQMIVIFYMSAVIFSVLLLSLPMFHKSGGSWSITDAFFTAVSAISVTGLSTISVPETFNTAGIFALSFVLQIGGIGLMTLGTFFWLVARKKIGFKERMLIMTDQNQSTYAGLVQLTRHILGLMISIELIGTLVLGTYFLTYFPDAKDAYFHGFFGAVSATTNAGFDITGASLVPYKDDYFVQIVHMILIVLGAIGFPVLIELKNYFLTKRKHQFRFSLFTKLTTVTFFILIVIGTIGIYLLERKHFFLDKTADETFFYALFQSVTTRSGGLATMDMNEFSNPTLVLISVLMFIGASPCSVGGGIRTTTLAINILAVKAFIRGKYFVTIFNREIGMEDIVKSFVVTFLGAFLCIFATIALLYTEDFSILQIVFEVCSAFGTTGLSMGITPDLSNIGKWILIALMFIGRMGILSTLLLFGIKKHSPKIRYPKEKVPIG